ncbi:MAG: hypothetical protein HY257_03675 [Chloroflexi bacterium]|nr:hypothetical protein [Chloroflexota bacterium]
MISKHPLKGYDAIQLAVALALRTNLQREDLAFTFVSADATLLQAAHAEQLATDNPLDHKDLDK